MKNLRFILHVALTSATLILLCFHYSSAQNSFPTPTGACELDATGVGANSGGELRLLELNANGANYVGLKGPDNIAANVLWTLPDEDGGNGNVLSTNGSGTLSFVKRVNTDLSNLKPATAINSSLVPGVSNSIDLGSPTFAWRNGYFLGTVGIGTTIPDNTLHVFKGSAGVVTGNINSPLVVENSVNCFVNVLAPDGSERGILFGDNLANNDGGIVYNGVANANGLQFRTNGNVNRMAITSAGDVGIDTNTPSTRLQILNGTDASLTLNGFLQLGATTSANLIFDVNEIMARSNGVNSTLFLQNSGGDLDISAGGLVLIGSTNNVTMGGTLDVASSISLTASGCVLSTISSDLSMHPDVVPDADDLHALGTSSLRWSEVWAADGSINTSDARDKTNVKQISYGLNEILKLQPVTYQWISRPDGGTKLGLIAQDLQKVLPEVVRDWEWAGDETTARTKVPSKRLGVMYDDIIPVLIKAIQEQNTIVAEKDSKINNQQQQIIQLTDRVTSLEATVSHPNSTDGTARFSLATDAQPVLGQNVPNPFDNSTLIPFRLPKNCKDASLRITETTTGSILRVIPLVCGETQVSIEAGQLASGNYTYSLYVDGNLIGTKQMTLTK